jgi:hypothetical protein
MVKAMLMTSIQAWPALGHTISAVCCDRIADLAASIEQDDQLLASTKAVGIIQPPIVVETEVGLIINAGNRRDMAAEVGLARLSF